MQQRLLCVRVALLVRVHFQQLRQLKPGIDIVPEIFYSVLVDRSCLTLLGPFLPTGDGSGLGLLRVVVWPGELLH